MATSKGPGAGRDEARGTAARASVFSVTTFIFVGRCKGYGLWAGPIFPLDEALIFPCIEIQLD